MQPEDGENLKDLFELADEVGNRRYHRLTQQDLEDYRKFDHWRYVNGDRKYGTTEASREWARENSDRHCPVCGAKFSDRNGRSIDHKLPRAQYPWLSLDFRNLWVICHRCNQEKGERHWYEYERYILKNHPNRFEKIVFFRPRQLLKTLREKRSP